MEPSDCIAALQQLVPGVERQPVRVIAGGWSFFTFAVGDLIVRFPRTDADAAGLDREFALLPVLAEVLPVSIPRYVIRGAWAGRPFGAYHAIRDEPVSLFAEPSLWADLGAALRVLHDLSLDIVRPLVGGVREAGIEPWSRLLEAAAPQLPPDLRRVVWERIEAHAASEGTRRQCLVHNDLGLVHVLSQGGRITGVIDWSDACIGDPAKDFAGILAQAGGGALHLALEAYGAADASFEERIRFYAWVAPLHEIVYGLATGQPQHVRDGVRGVTKRLALFG